MSVKGTDLQTLIVRSPEAGKIQQTQKTEEFAKQQNFAIEMTKQSELTGNTIQNLPRTEQAKINSDQAKKEKRTLQKRNGQIKDDESAEGLPISSGNIIDYKI